MIRFNRIGSRSRFFVLSMISSENRVPPRSSPGQAFSASCLAVAFSTHTLDAFWPDHYRSRNLFASWPCFGAGRAKVLSLRFQEDLGHVAALRADRQNPADRA